MRKPFLRRVVVWVIIAFSPFAGSAGYSGEATGPAPSALSVPRKHVRAGLTAEERAAMNAAIKTANTNGVERVAVIFDKLREAGYEVEIFTLDPHAFRIISPAVSGRAPAFKIELYPEGVSVETHRMYANVTPVPRGFNAPLAFNYFEAYHPEGFDRPLPGCPREFEILNRDLLRQRVSTALNELPDIRTLAPRAPEHPDPRQRELSERIRRLDELQQEVSRWHAEAVAPGVDMSKTQREQASTLESLVYVLEESIGTFQQERLGPPSTPTP